MAIQFARMEYVGRSNGKNACCKSSYNSRSKIKDESTNITYNFARLKDNVHHEIMLPSHVNEKFKTLQILANTVEQKEQKINSQLYREYVLALPDEKELTLEDRIELSKEFIKRKGFVGKGFSVQLDIHAPHADEKNWHAHILVPTRSFKECGLELGAKNREMEVRGGKNCYVADESKDHISVLWKNILEERGIKVDPISLRANKHVSIGGIWALSEKEINTVKTSAASIKNAEELIDFVSEKKAVFSFDDLEREVSAISSDSKIMQELRDKAKDLLLSLFDKKGETTKFFTTPKIRTLEENIVKLSHRVFSNKIQNKVLESPEHMNQLNKGQQSALRELFKREDGVVILRGSAGTGKTHLFGVVRKVIPKDQKIIALAPTKLAANELRSRGYEANTIKGFLYKQHGLNKPTNLEGAVILIDEAAMVGSTTYLELFKVAAASKAQIWLCGDDKQLPSVDAGGMFSILSQKFGHISLDEVVRQKNDWGIKVSEKLASGDVKGAVEVLYQENKLRVSENRKASFDSLLKDWAKSDCSLNSRLMLTVSNADVDRLNFGAREVLRQQGVLWGDDFLIENDKTKGSFAVNDRIIVTQTDKELGINNGEMGAISEATLEKFTILFDDGRKIEFDPKDVFFRHAYAVTVFKSQSSSIRQIFCLHNSFSTRQNSYVGLTRQIEDLHLYINTEDTKNIAELVKQFSNEGMNLSSLNYLIQKDVNKAPERGNGKQPSTIERIFSRVAETVFGIDSQYPNSKYYDYVAPEHVPNQVRIVERVVMEKIFEVNQHEQGSEKNLVHTISKLDEKMREKEVKNIVEKALDGQSNDNKRLEFAQSVGRQKYDAWNDGLARLRNELRYKADFVVRDLLGEENKALSSKFTLRFGQKGSLAVDIDGEKAGTWIDFSTGKGGDLFALIMQERGGDFSKAVKIASEYCSSVSFSIPREQDLKRLSVELKSQDKSQKVVSLYNKTVDIGPKAVEYLRARGISMIEGADLRFLPEALHSNERKKFPAIVAFARDENGKLSGAQMIYLDQNLAKKADVSPAKRSLGGIKSAFVSIQRENLSDTKDGITILAEGVETALSLKEARIPGKILATLGISNFKNYKATLGEIVVLAADFDGKNAATKLALDSAIKILEQQGAKVFCIKPSMPGVTSCDFNDVIVKQGFAQIQRDLMPTIEKYLGPIDQQKVAKLHQEMANSGLTKQEVMEKIAENKALIRANWDGGNPAKDFCVKDFLGQKHTTESSYFLALASDTKMKNLIDYSSPLGKQIESSVQVQISQNKQFTL